MNIVCAELLGLSNDFNFWGNAFNYSNTQNITVKGRIKNFDDSVTGIWTGMSSMISSASSELIPIIVNGVNLGSGNINSITFDEATDVNLKFYTIGFTVTRHPGTGLYDNYGGLSMTGSNYSGLSSVVSSFNSPGGKFINNFSENSVYNSIASGRYSYSKDISFNIDTGIVSELGFSTQAFALSFIDTLKKSYTDTNIISAFYPDFYKFNSGILKTTQAFDIVNNQFRYSEKFDFDTGKNYTWKYNNSFSLDNGVIIISENGEIQSSQYNGYTLKTAEDAWSIIDTGIYTRVSGMYRDYTGLISQTGLCMIPNQPQSESITRDKCAGIIRYSKSYSNGPFTKTGYFHSYNSSISMDENGYITVTEGGNFKSYKNIQPSGFNLSYSGFLSQTGAIENRITSTYLTYKTGLRSLCNFSTGLKKESSEITYREYEGQVDYSYTYSEDPSLFNNLSGIYKIVVTNRVDLPTHNVNYFPINYDKVIAQRMDQSTRGIYSNSIDIYAKGFSLQNYINTAINYATSPSGTDVILSNYSYSLEPLDNKFSMELSYSYTNYRAGDNFLI